MLFLITFFFTYDSNLKEKIYFISIFFLIFIFIFSNPNLKKRIVDNTIFNITEKIIHSNQAEEITKKDELNTTFKDKFNINIFSLGHQGHFNCI